jgi:hypothetical protein
MVRLKEMRSIAQQRGEKCLSKNTLTEKKNCFGNMERGMCVR